MRFGQWATVFLLAGCAADNTPTADDDPTDAMVGADGEAGDLGVEIRELDHGTLDPDMDIDPPDMSEPEPIVCSDPTDCFDALGERARCVGGADGQPDPDAPANNDCRVDLGGLGYRLTAGQFTRPEGLSALFNPVINDVLRTGGFSPVVFLQSVDRWVPDEAGFSAVYDAWIFNASAPDGVTVGPREDHPTNRAVSRAQRCEDPAYTSCHAVLSEEVDDAGRAQHVTFWLPHPTREGPCGLQPLQVAATVELSVAADDEPAFMRIRAALRISDARRFIVELPGIEQQSLRDLLDRAAIPRTLDTNGDGALDSWEIHLEGPAEPVGVMGNLEGARGRSPCE